MIKQLLTLSAASTLVLALGMPVVAQASEQEHFREAVEEAIGPIVREDISKAIEETEHLVKQAAEIVAEAAHGFHDNEKLLLEITSSSTAQMLTQSPEELEESWAHGEAFNDKGFALDDFDHFSKVMAYYDMIVHPATAHSLLKAYQQNPDHSLLEQAREELGELLEHEESEEGEEGEEGAEHGKGH
ncbi:MAG: hypothetical protein V7752_22045 [Halopseudomonas sp.]